MVDSVFHDVLVHYEEGLYFCEGKQSTLLRWSGDNRRRSNMARPASDCSPASLSPRSSQSTVQSDPQSIPNPAHTPHKGFMRPKRLRMAAPGLGLRLLLVILGFVGNRTRCYALLERIKP